jgi:phenylpropionate dioxygenase-like ring-hydroxylating dioxygenase large terminal subunit
MGLKPGDANKAIPIQKLLDEETVEVPWVLRDERYEFLGDEDLPAERYFSQEFFDLEVEKLWPRVWQLACFEQDIPNVGDSIVYNIIDWSFIVIRSAPDRIQAFHNVCLHRGRQLRTNDCESACVPELRCPFHGFAWNIDGTFKGVGRAMEWDFPHLDPSTFGLPEVRCETWDGLVFINMDADAEPLVDFLGDLTRHFERWPFKDRHKAAHVAKIMPANWKVALEAFIEGFHVVTTHPQFGLLHTDGTDSENDIYPNFNRSIGGVPMPNPNLPYAVTEQDVLDEVLYLGTDVIEPEKEPGRVLLPEGMTARKYLADRARDNPFRQYRRPIGGEETDVEHLSAIWYWVFPNWFPWPGPVFYRFGPYGRDPEMCVMEAILMVEVPEGRERPPAAKVRWLGVDDNWADATELGPTAEIFNQDSGNIPYVQKGLKSMAYAKPSKGVTLGNYLDIRVRHFHVLLDQFMSNGE